jgi:CO dehydrogenase/acetyl-CoA synthase beta subunit
VILFQTRVRVELYDQQVNRKQSETKFCRMGNVGGLWLPKVLKNMIWQCFPSEICEQVSSDSDHEYTEHGQDEA